MSIIYCRTATSMCKRKNILVQVSPISSRSLQLVNVSELVHALCHDPDLARVNPSTLPEILQTVYAVSGCDYVSFFSEVGKAASVPVVLCLPPVINVAYW